jgi:hypothetical protein
VPVGKPDSLAHYHAGAAIHVHGDCPAELAEQQILLALSDDGRALPARNRSDRLSSARTFDRLRLTQ